MTAKELICYIILIGLLVYFVDDKEKSEVKVNLLHEMENVAVPDDYRKIIGYDSVQMVFLGGKWEANFCYPNEWVLNQLKIDTVK